MPKPAGSDSVFDTIFIGAGISGFGMAMKFKEQFPNKTFSILEARDDIGGTWNFFKYPGLRSDSFMTTLGFSKYPWKDNKMIADSSDIMEYLRDVVEKENFMPHIQFNSKVSRCDFNSKTAIWTVTLETGRTIQANFIVNCAGYYNYTDPQTPSFKGQSAYQGQIVHPQFWPEGGLDVEGKEVAIIGSGATSITLAPSLLKQGARKVHVLQRSPSYIWPLARYTGLPDLGLTRMLSERLWWAVCRFRDLWMPNLMYWVSRTFPNFMKAQLVKGAIAEATGSWFRSSVLSKQEAAVHFTPWYSPWEQRLLVDADGEFMAGVRAGNVVMHTGAVEGFTPKGVSFAPATSLVAPPAKVDGHHGPQQQLAAAEEVSADIVITATGLQICPAVNLPLYVDGEEVVFTETFMFKTCMLTSVPNCLFVMGYLNSSWTLKVELLGEYLCKVIRHIDQAVAKAPAPARGVFAPQPPPAGEPVGELEFNSMYLLRALPKLPRWGLRQPWGFVQNYSFDKKQLSVLIEEGCEGTVNTYTVDA